MSEQRIDVIRSAMAAWARHDIDGVLEHVSPTIEWHYQVGSKPVLGRDRMRKMLEGLQQHQRESKWRLVRYAEADGFVMIEAVDDYTNPDGHRVRVPYMGVYEFDAMTITAWRDYVDLGLIMKAEAGEEPGEWLASLIEA